MSLKTFEPFFQEFIIESGGEVLPELNTARNADYLFRSEEIICELKVLEEDKEAAHAQRLQAFARDWHNRGLIRIYGRVVISLRDIRPECQQEWLKYLEGPVENIIRDANRQIRSTKDHEKLPKAKGLLLVANEGNYLHTDPTDYMILVARILRKRHPDNTPRFPHIDGVVYFSRQVRTRHEGMPFWIPGITANRDSIMTDFQEKLRRDWLKYISKVTGQTIREVFKEASGDLTAHVTVDVSGAIQDGQYVVTATVRCNQCGSEITLVSNGENTPQIVTCPFHGEIIAFKTRDQYEALLKEFVNKNAEARGLQVLDANVKGRFQSE